FEHSYGGNGPLRWRTSSINSRPRAVSRRSRTSSVSSAIEAVHGCCTDFFGRSTALAEHKDHGYASAMLQLGSNILHVSRVYDTAPPSSGRPGVGPENGCGGLTLNTVAGSAAYRTLDRNSSSSISR